MAQLYCWSIVVSLALQWYYHHNSCWRTSSEYAVYMWACGAGHVTPNEISGQQILSQHQEGQCCFLET